MATAKQIRANQKNSHHSTGAKTAAGKQASSKNSTKHGLSTGHCHTTFYLLDDEDVEKYHALLNSLVEENKPQTQIEIILVRRLAQHEWLRARALRLQRTCIPDEAHVAATEQFALYMRYQTTHERAFYRALNELQNIRNERRKAQIGFVSQKQSAELHQLKKQSLELKNLRAIRLLPPEKKPNAASQPVPEPETSPGNTEMAA